MSIHGRSEKRYTTVDTVQWRRWRSTTAGRVLTNDWGAHYVTRVYRNARLCVVVVRARNRGVIGVRRCMGCGNHMRMMKNAENPSRNLRNYSNGATEGEEEEEEKRNNTTHHVRNP